MDDLPEKYCHQGWEVEFTGREHADGKWDDSCGLMYIDGEGVCGTGFTTLPSFSSKREALISAMTKAKNWIETDGPQFLAEKKAKQRQG